MCDKCKDCANLSVHFPLRILLNQKRAAGAVQLRWGQSCPSDDGHQQFSGLDRLSGLYEHLADLAVYTRDHAGLHLHGLADGHDLVDLDGVAGLYADLAHHTGYGCADLALVLGVGHCDLVRRVRGGGVRHGDLAAGAVEFKDHVACAVLVAVAEPQVLYDQGLAVLYVYEPGTSRL